MTPDERELRRAFEARSGELSPQFRARLGTAFDEAKPATGLRQAVAVFAVVAITLGTVGVLLMSRATRNASTGGETRYTVTTHLMSAKGGPLRACYFEPLPYPPIGCDGVDVTNVDVASISGAVTSSNGTVSTPQVKLVGTWDGRHRILNLTEPPLLVKPYTSTPPRVVGQAPPASNGKTAAQTLYEIRRDEPTLQQRGIVVLSSGEGFDGVEVTLAVADPKSVQYLYDTYGRMKILGWLQPVGGTTPVPSPTPTPAIFMPTTARISAPSSDVVWVLVADRLLFRSTDRGTTWERRSAPPVGDGGSPREISFVDANNGWYFVGGVPGTQCIQASSELWHTTNGGASWQLTDGVIPLTQCKEVLSFIDPTHGFLGAGDPNHKPTIYRTADSGMTWSASTLPDPPGFVTQAGGGTLRLSRIKGFGNTVLALATANGANYIFRSTDAGATWTYQASITNNTGPIDPTFVTASRWLVIGNDGSGQETTDAGKTWHPFSTDYADAAGVASTFEFADGNVGYGTVRGGLHRTVDGGSHWIVIKTPGVYQP